MSIYSYNSNHKVITAILILVVISLLHFMTKEEGKDDIFFENGQVKAIGRKEKGVNQGTWTWYYPNGNKMMEGKFVDGKREGTWIQFDSDGHKSMTSEYQNNSLNGLLIEYDINGYPVRTFEYRQDTIYKRLTDNL